jgi:hypothetical protein
MGPPQAQPASAAAAKSVLQQDKVVAGSAEDFMEVRHIVLKGTNEEVGRALATIAKERFQAHPAKSDDRLRTRAQRKYIEKNQPILFERMRGVAAAFGKSVDDDGFNFSGLGYPPGAFGCSVIHLPPKLTATGTSIVSRNYDFSTGTLLGARSPKGTLPATARPCIVEMHPDKGYASIAMYSYDMVNGVLDGINSEGLTVALLADDETMQKYSMEPAGMDAAGLGELMTQRMLLDTCANVEEAKEALLMTKQQYGFIPVHYIVSDRHGKSFVWEYSHAHNREYIIENPGKPLITTNFSLHRHLEGNRVPTTEKSRKICDRYCEMAGRLEKESSNLSVEQIKTCHCCADATGPASATRAPTRTLWHALYVPEERKLQVSFYLRDEPNPNNKTKPKIVRTDYLDFALPRPK